MDKLLERFDLAWKKFAESWTACLVCMVGGDFTIININHAITASKTGFGSAVALVLLTAFTKIPNKWAMAWLTSVVVFGVDLMIHANHAHIYGEGWWREAAVTGVGAGILGLVMHNLYRK